MNRVPNPYERKTSITVECQFPEWVRIVAEFGLVKAAEIAPGQETKQLDLAVQLCNPKGRKVSEIVYNLRNIGCGIERDL